MRKLNADKLFHIRDRYRDGSDTGYELLCAGRMTKDKALAVCPEGYRLPTLDDLQCIKTDVYVILADTCKDSEGDCLMIGRTGAGFDICNLDSVYDVMFIRTRAGLEVFKPRKYKY